jgi:hypothetical protein
VRIQYIHFYELNVRCSGSDIIKTNPAHRSYVFGGGYVFAAHGITWIHLCWKREYLPKLGNYLLQSALSLKQEHAKTAFSDPKDFLNPCPGGNICRFCAIFIVKTPVGSEKTYAQYVHYTFLFKRECGLFYRCGEKRGFLYPLTRGIDG